MDKKTRDVLVKEYLGNCKSGFDINSQEGSFYSSCSLYTLLESIQRISRILINNSSEFKLDWGDSAYGAKLFKVFYNATAKHGPLPDAVCRTLLQLNFAEDMDYLQSQVKWDLSNDTDDSFLYLIYQKRIDNLKNSLSVRERQKAPTYFMEKIPSDEHPTLSDAVLKKKIRRMEKLRDRFGKTASAYEEQYYWLDLDAPAANKSNIEEAGNLDSLLRDNSVTCEEFQQNITMAGKGFTCNNAHFLSEQGFCKDAIENKGGEKNEILRADIFKRIHNLFQDTNSQCDTATKLMKYLKRSPYSTSDDQYIIKSVKSTATKQVYYFIIRTPRPE